MKHEDLPYESRWTSWHTNQTDFRSTPQIDALRLFLWHLWCFLRELDKEACNETLIWPGCICAAGVHTHNYLVSMRMCIPTIRKHQPAENGTNWNNDARKWYLQIMSPILLKMSQVKATSGRTVVKVQRTCNKSNGTTTTSWFFCLPGFVMEVDSIETAGRFALGQTQGDWSCVKSEMKKEREPREKREFFFFYRDLLLVLSLKYDTLFTYLFSWWYPIKNPYLASVTNCLWIGFNKEKPRT